MKLKVVYSSRVKSDIILIQEILEGNQASFDRLYRRYEKVLFSICLRYARNKMTAEDFFQEGLVQLFRNLSRYDSKKGQFLPWAKTVIVNICIKQLGKRKTIETQATTDDIQIPTYSESIIDRLSFDEILDLIQELPEGYRTVFNLYVLDGYSHAEIADKLNIGIGTSKSQLHKAKRQIAELITNRFADQTWTERYG